MRRNPLYIFKDTTSIGIYEIPLKSTVHLVDQGNGYPMFLQLVKKNNLDQYSTMQDLLDNPDHYIDITASGASISQLESIIEDGKQGWRILGRDNLFYGDIGIGAIDFSENVSADIGTGGATGDSSFALGIDTIAAGQNAVASGNVTEANGMNSFAAGDGSKANGANSIAFGQGTVAKEDGSAAFGKFNETVGALKDGLMLSVGNGQDTLTPTNIFEVYKDGRVVAPNLDISEITDNKSLVTKEYIDNGTTESQLEIISEGGNTGWRILGRDPAYYGDIGEGAVDFSNPAGANNANGATGDYSFAGGRYIVASGEYSTAFGYGSVAAGDRAVALGYNTIATHQSAVAIGSEAHAYEEYAVAIGRNARAHGKDSYSLGHLSESNGEGSFATGYRTLADGVNSFTAGSRTGAVGENSAAFGLGAGTAPGASGAFAAGNGVMVAGIGGAAFGTYNIGTSLSHIFEVGIGTSTISKNAFEIDKDGNITAPSLTIGMIDSLNNERSLITREYIQSSSELERIDCGSSPGCDGSLIPGSSAYRLRHRVQDGNDVNYNSPGAEAIDFSYSDNIATGAKGATGVYAFAEGHNTLAMGTRSHAAGWETIANQDNQFVLGQYNDHNTADGSVFVVGIGDSSLRKNALVVYNDGRVEAPSLVITNSTSIINKQYVDGLFASNGLIIEDFDVITDTLEFAVSSVISIPIISSVLINGIKIRPDDIPTSTIRDYSISDNAADTTTITLAISAKDGDWVEISYTV